MNERQDLEIVTETLAKMPGSFLCGGCLALAARMSLQAARDAMETLTDDAKTERRHGPCSVCARTLDLIAVAPGHTRAA